VARRISERLKDHARVVIYELAFEAEDTISLSSRCNWVKPKNSPLNLAPRARRSGSVFLYFACIMSHIFLSTMHHDWLHFRFDNTRAPTLVSARS